MKSPLGHTENLPLSPQDRLIFALDVPDRPTAKRYVNLLKDSVGLFKIGLELFISEGPAIVSWIVDETGAGVFLDLKLHDIPETMTRAIAACPAGVRFLTIHLDHGLVPAATPERAFVARPQDGLQLLAVTLLTSIGKEELTQSGYQTEFREDTQRLVLERARWARDRGCAGVVCSPCEAKAIKQRFESDLLVVTPGIRPSWSGTGSDDQKRILTPSEAVRAGADYIVVGRPIRDAKDPTEAAAWIVAEIKEAQNQGKVNNDSRNKP